MAQDNARRSLFKTFSWRAAASLDTLALSFLVMALMRPSSSSEAAAAAAVIAAVEVPNKLLLYYLHERLWARLKWGLPVEPEYRI